MTYVYLTLAIISEVFATSFLKATEGFSVLWPSVAVICGYGAAFYFLSLSLTEIPVGVAYAVWSGLGVVLICLISWLVHHQRLDWPAVLGVSMIVCGVICIKMFSKAI